MRRFLILNITCLLCTIVLSGCWINNYYKSLKLHSTIKFPYDNFDSGNKIISDGYYKNNLFASKFWFYKNGYACFADCGQGQCMPGLYTILRDSLIAVFYGDGIICDFNKFHFNIINDSTLRLDRITKSPQFITHSDFVNEYFFFHKTGSTPELNCPELKKKRFLWKDEKSWKKWMSNKGYKVRSVFMQWLKEQ